MGEEGENMAYIYPARLIWRGDSGKNAGHEFIGSPLHAPTWGATVTFANAMEAKSLCNVSFLNWNWINGFHDSAPGASADVDKRAVIYFRDTSTLEVFKFEYPSPLAADIEDVGWGKVIKKTVVIAIVTLINTMSGTSYQPMYGVYFERK